MSELRKFRNYVNAPDAIGNDSVFVHFTLIVLVKLHTSTNQLFITAKSHLRNLLLSHL